MLPWPVCPLAGHARLGQHVVAGSMTILLSWRCWGACQEGVCLDPHFHCNCTAPRFSGELPIIDPEDIRRHPSRTTIPYYVVDAVVHVPFGAFPGTCPGVYVADTTCLGETIRALDSGDEMRRYLETYVYSVASFADMLEQRVGVKRLLELNTRERYREGYYDAS
jgi:hypothetical protein